MEIERGGVVGRGVEAGRRRRSRSTVLPAAFRFSTLLVAVIVHGGNASASSGDVVASVASASDPDRRGRGHLAPSSSADAALAALLAAPPIPAGRRSPPPAGTPVPVGGRSTRRRVDLVNPGAVRGHVCSPPGPAERRRLGSRVGDDDIVARSKVTDREEDLATTSDAPISSSSPPPSTIKVALASYSTVILLSALSNVLSDRPPITPDLVRDLGASILCAILGYAYVKAITELAKSGLLEPRDSRKIIHTGSAPLFMMFWPLFSDGVEARFFAGVVPLINAFRLYAAGTSGGGGGGGTKNAGTTGTSSREGEGGKGGDGDGDGDGRRNAGGASDLAYSVSRSGDAREALGGPFVYVLILLLSTVLFWRDGMVGVMALSTMAAGDGMADIVGRRFGKTNKWPFSPDKSVAGSAAFFVSSLATSSALRAWFLRTGVLLSSSSSSSLAGSGDVDQVLLRMAAVCAACALVELLPLGDDNWTVPGTAAALAALLLG